MFISYNVLYNKGIGKKSQKRGNIIMKKTVFRILCLTLVLMCLFSFTAIAQAETYTTNSVWEAKTSSYLFKNTAYVTIKNTCDDPIQIAVGYTGCTVYRGTGAGFQTYTTLYPGNSATYRIVTPALWKKGKVQFGVRNLLGRKYSYTISQSKVDSLKRIK